MRLWLISMFTSVAVILFVNSCAGDRRTNFAAEGDTTTVVPSPGAFAITSATSADASVVLTWGDSSDADSYTITYGTASGTYATTFSSTATSPTTVTGLTNETLYYFMVTAVNAEGSTNATTEASATPSKPSWIQQLGDTAEGTLISAGASDGSDVVNDIAIDSSGNIYSTGYTTGSLGETNGGFTDIFITKYNRSGTLQWIRQLGNAAEGTIINAGASDGNDIGKAIAVDSTGNVYVAGYTDGDLGETNGGSDDVVLIKYDSDGTFQWIQQLGDTAEGTILAASAADSVDLIFGLTIDSLDNIYLTGRTSGALGETNGGSNDVILIKYNTSGTFQWIEQLGDTAEGTIIAAGASDSSDFGRSVATDTAGNIYIGGYSNGDLGETNGGNDDAIYIKYNSAGTFQWVKQLGDTAEGTIIAAGASDAGDFIIDVASDSSDNIYLTGYSFGDLFETNGGAGTTDAFVFKINSSGTIQWSIQLGDTAEGTIISAGAADSNDIALGLDLDSSGNVFVTGQSTGALGETNGGGGLNDVFLFKVDSTGTFQWIRQLGDVAEGTIIGAGAADSNDYSRSIKVDSLDNVYIGGNSGGNLGETNGGSNDHFIIKYTNDGSL